MRHSPITIIVEPSRAPGQGGKASHFWMERAEILRRDSSALFGLDIPILERYLAEAPPEGAILLFGSAIEDLENTPRALASRVILLNGRDRKTLPSILFRHGFAGALDWFHFASWIKGTSETARIHVRHDIAVGFGATNVTDSAAGYVVVEDERYRSLVSLLAACCAVLTGRTLPMPNAPRESPPFPIDHTIGHYVIRRCVSGTAACGLYIASDPADEFARNVYVSLGPRQTIAWDEKRAELCLPFEGIAPMVDIVAIEYADTQYDALIEKCPGGVAASELLPLPFSAWRTARVLLPLIDWLEGVHRHGKVVWGLRPESLFMALGSSWPDDEELLSRIQFNRPHVTGIAPRCERFLATAERPHPGFASPFDTPYLAPEIFGGGPVGPMADVFSLGVMIAHWVGGKYPFAGETFLARVNAMMTGGWTRFDGPAELMNLLEAALSPKPAMRPALGRVRHVLGNLAQR